METTNSTSIDGLSETIQQLGARIEKEGSQWFTVKMKVRFYQTLKLKCTTKTLVNTRADKQVFF